MPTIGLSPSSLSSFKDCHRCFWMEKNGKVPKPRGIQASLPGGMDLLMKAHVDSMIATGREVSWLKELPGATPFKDRVRLQKFMKWQTFQVIVNGPDGLELKAWGNVDDVIQHEDGRFTPWDFKTKGSEPDADYGKKYYQLQLDMYHLLLEGNGCKCTGKGVLSYGWPLGINLDGSVQFGWKNLVLDTDPQHAVEMMAKAAKVLAGPCPPAPPHCEYCNFVAGRSRSKTPAAV